jgi:phosphatidylinositol kinase/protein kinase (PI-3  family)
MESGFRQSSDPWNRASCQTGCFRNIDLSTHSLRFSKPPSTMSGTPPDHTRLVVNQQHLKAAWDVSQVTSREDWLEWRRRLAVEFMKESPSQALRACKSLADAHLPLALELFNAAFVSCWTEMYEQYQVILLWRTSLSFR